MRHRMWCNPRRTILTSYWHADYERVQEVLQGAEEPWEQLYKNAYQKVLGFARQTDWKNILQPQDYDEIVDEAFARCYEHLDRYRGESRFSTWVGGYAKNIARNRCSRQQTRLRNKGHLEDLARNQMANSDPYFVLLRYERDNCLWGAFFDLDETDQEIVKRRVLENDAPRQIARELQMTRKEVLNRYECAKVTMRRLFLYYYNHMQQ